MVIKMSETKLVDLHARYFCQKVSHGLILCGIQVFIIGAVKQVRKAEAILRGRMVDFG